MKVKWIGGATTVIQIDQLKIICDPVLCDEGTVQDYRYFKSKRLNRPLYEDKTFEDVDILLLTHDHMDHLDDIAKDKITTEIAITNRTIKNLKAKQQIILKHNEEHSIYSKFVDLNVKAIQSIHGRNKLIGNLVGHNNGYLVEAKTDNNEYLIYITGDDVFKNEIDILKNKNIDLIIAYAGAATVGNGILGKLIGKITNDSNDIRKIEESYNPKWIMPIHWGTFSHYNDKKYTKDMFGKNVLLISPGEEIEI